MASDGHIELPTKPGLGFDLIESEVEKAIQRLLEECRLVLDNLAIVVEDL